MHDLIAQALGFLAMGLCISCYQIKSSKLLLVFQTLGNLTYIIHYLMLGAYSGCISMAILAISCIPICFGFARKMIWFKYLCSAALIASCIYTWEDIFSIFPCIASIGFVLTTWKFNGKIIRLAKLFCVGPGWIIYAIYHHSYAGIIGEVIGMLSVAISIWRYGLKTLDKLDC